MKFVWNESLNQTDDMLAYWTGGKISNAPSVSKDTRTLSLNVLAATGFRRPYKFHGSEEPRSKDSSSYRDALQTVLDNAILLMVLPRWVFSLPLKPKSLAVLRKAADDFKKYMVQMLKEETELFESNQEGNGGLMTSFVRSLEISQGQIASQAKSPTSSPPKSLSVEEIYGNIFVINFAGHDTTANTLAFAILLLSAHPDIQDWVGEELETLSGDLQFQSWDYNKLFPKLLRCRSILVRPHSHNDPSF